MEREGKPPTSRYDSLVAVVGCMEVERPEKTTNESSGLVGSGGGCLFLVVVVDVVTWR